MAEFRPPKSTRTLIAEKAVNDALPSEWRQPHGPKLEHVGALLQASDVKSNPALKIGIIGAGAAGLCTAMILRRAFEILEARPRDPGQPAPVGGRMFTHYFDQSVPPQQYDYFDVGAMRSVFSITFGLFSLFEQWA